MAVGILWQGSRLQCRVIRFANLIEALDAAPAERPFITFWVDEDEQETVSFGEFRRLARVEALGLREHAVGAGDRVVIIMPQGIGAMKTFVAAMMIRAAPAFLAYPNFKIEPAKYRSGLAGVTANLGAKAVVIDQDFPDEMLSCVSVGDDALLIRAGGNTISGKAKISDCVRDEPRLESDNLAFIQHSAGTTGLQKGVALSHAAVLRQIEYLSGALKIDARADRIYSWLPLYHDMGLIACFMLPMACHVPIVMQSPVEWVMRPESMLQIISDYKCTVAWMPNFAFQFVPRRTPQGRWKSYDLSSLRLLINCSEPVRGSSMKEFQDAFRMQSRVLQSSYAMAENVFAVTQSDIGRGPDTVWADRQQFRAVHQIVPLARETPEALSFTSSGGLLPNQRVQILSESGEMLGEDSVGEIVIQGDCLFDGYYNRADLTAEAIVDGWFHSGDLGFVHGGQLYVVGRKKDLIIVGGENIYPQDIEEIVASHPAVHDGRVVAMGLYKAELGTEDIVVVAEVKEEAALAQTSAIEQEIRSRIVAGLGIAVHTIVLKPQKWIVKSTAGKPARSATRAKLLHEHPEFKTEA